MTMTDRVSTVASDVKRGGWFGQLFVTVLLITVVFFVLEAVRASELEQPISITTCDSASFDRCPPFRGVKGAVHSAAGPIAVQGEVCNSSDRDIPVQYLVGYESLTDPGTTYLVLDIGSTIVPGCTPYGFEYVVPEQLVLAYPDSDFGQWKIIGKAIPVNADVPVYQWDLTGPFMLID